MGNATRRSAVLIEQTGAATAVFPLFFAISRHSSRGFLIHPGPQWTGPQGVLPIPGENPEKHLYAA
jgi:hypothetical protein